jgi:ABC-type transport system involved in multi-copper enzyme maturation permease subunit
MYIYIKDGEFRYFSEEQKENFNIIQKFAVVVNNFFESLQRYILFIVYLIMLLVAAVDYAYYIRAPLLKINMLIISFVLSIICFSMILSNFINHANSDENA